MLAQDRLLPSWMYYGSFQLGRRIAIPPEKIHQVLRSGPPYYRTFEIPKRSGGTRSILAPMTEMAYIQGAILDRILRYIPVSEIAHGGVKGKSIVTAAKPHTLSHSIICLDIANAFGRTNLFAENLYDQSNPSRLTKRDVRTSSNRLMLMIRYFTHVRTRDIIPVYYLPQGAPTSNACFDLACRNMDRRLTHLAENVGGVVTRYVDNICFSVSGDSYLSDALINAVMRVIERCGFGIQSKKTLVVKNGNIPGKPLRLSGVNIIDSEIRLNPRKIDRLRTMLYYAYLFNDRARINGVLGYLKMIYGEELPPRLARVVKRGKRR